MQRIALLAGVSAIALLAGGGAQARPLFGGANASSAVTSAANAAIANAQQAAQIASQSLKSLSRATQTLQAMQAAQAAARSAAAGQGSLPNGLVPGGLQVAPGASSSNSQWLNANLPTQSTSGGQTQVTVQQTAQKAILTWSSFNIGANTTLYFDQSPGNTSAGNNWVALNRITDPTGVPSQILGQIKAEGAVYLINQNGIIFGGSSQVNVSTLIASSLNLFSNDINASNNRFLTGGIGDLNANNFATNSILLTTDTPGAGGVTVAKGASINVGNQGLALLAAPNVTNSGAITAPGGQVALVAGIGVSYDYNQTSFLPGSGSDSQGTNDNSTTNLRFANYGKLVDANGNDITPVGSLVNDGLIYTPRGNITMLGGAVQQNGVAIATTSVAQPGSIVIESLYEVGVNAASLSPADESTQSFYTGPISFGSQAITSILPDSNGVTLSSDATSLSPFKSQLEATIFTSPLPTQGPGLVSIIGQAIDFKAGTLVYAPGQTLSASTVASIDPRVSVPGSGRVLLEEGAILDVSGIPDTELPASSNLLTVKLGGNELADDPLQQNGFLFGTQVTVDMGAIGVNAETGEAWVGTPLANLTSYANLVQNSIGQLLVNGGAVFLEANEFVGAPGSIINLNGGYVHYLGGTISTTRLIDAYGRLEGIGNADPNIPVVGIAGQFTVDHSHWNVTEIYSDPLYSGSYYQSDYIQGGNAGKLTIVVNNTNDGSLGALVTDSGTAILDSTLLAGTVAGMRQVAAGILPDGGSFTFTGIEPIEIGDPGVLSAQSLVALSLPRGFTMATPLPATPGSAYTTNVVNSQILDNADLSTISLTNAGSNTALSQPIVEDAGTSLTVQPGGSITLFGGRVTIDGNLTARGGAISITTAVSVASVAGATVDFGAGRYSHRAGCAARRQRIFHQCGDPASRSASPGPADQCRLDLAGGGRRRGLVRHSSTDHRFAAGRDARPERQHHALPRQSARSRGRRVCVGQRSVEDR